ncbi:MAG: hypothetical protein LKF31_02995 [Muribaculaceae bacterium]|jgi:hypothetical protein|nr:hypothetical protein [Muribaculaceae bacterium]
MKLFKKKNLEWWAKNHPPTNSFAASVEKVLNDNWFAYHYDSTSDSFFLTLKRVIQDSLVYNIIINCRHYTIKTYTGLPIVYQKDHKHLNEVLQQISKESELINLEIDDMTKLITTSLNIYNIQEFNFIIPILIEQATIIDCHHEQINKAYESPKNCYIRTISDYHDFMIFDKLIINRIIKIDGEYAIAHLINKK